MLKANEIKSVVQSVYWLLKYTSEEYAKLSPREQMVINLAWDEIRMLYEAKFNYTKADGRLQGAERSEGQKALEQRARELAKNLAKVSSHLDT